MCLCRWRGGRHWSEATLGGSRLCRDERTLKSWRSELSRSTISWTGTRYWTSSAWTAFYLNAYVPVLQSSGQVVAFMTQHLGMPIPSPALMEKISTRFRRGVESFASANGIAWVRFAKADRKLEVMQEYLDRQAATGRSGVAAVGVAQEFQRVWTAYQRDTRTAAPQYTFAKVD